MKMADKLEIPNKEFGFIFHIRFCWSFYCLVKPIIFFVFFSAHNEFIDEKKLQMKLYNISYTYIQFFDYDIFCSFLYDLELYKRCHRIRLKF